MIYLLTIVVAATRFLPHPPNFVCIGALGLFAGCYVAGRKAYWVPAAALLISDAVGAISGIGGLGFYAPAAMLATYGGMTLAVPIGRLLRRRRASGSALVMRVPLAALGSAITFFLISNLGVFLSGWYTPTVSGLIACYVAAIPFFGYTLAADLFYGLLLFGLYEMASAVATLRHSNNRAAWAAVASIDRS